ncbi:MAG: UbiA prenyltransferase family protein [Bacteroidia bacterium]
MSKIKHFAKLLRVNQWVKNGFLFLPIFFDKQLLNMSVLADAFLGALSFAFVSSVVYIVNDYFDRNRDRLHPKKKFRPIAAGLISPITAFVVAIICLVISVLLVLYLNSIELAYVLAIYLVLNILYSTWLKHVSLLDIFILAFGYVLRVYAGGFATQIAPSEWLILMSLLLALFLALAKRRDDVVLFENSGKKTRKAIDGYNQSFFNTALSMLGGIIVVTYSIYVLSDQTQERFGSDYMYLTVIFILAGVLRYLQITLVEHDSGSPVKLLYSDRFLQVTILLWLSCLYVIIY